MRPMSEWDRWFLRRMAALALSDDLRALEVIAPPARYLGRTYLRTACDLLEIAARRPRDGTFGLHAFSRVDDAVRNVRFSRRTIQAMREDGPLAEPRRRHGGPCRALLARFLPHLVEVAGRYTHLRRTLRGSLPAP